MRVRVTPELSATTPWLLRPPVGRAERLLRHMMAPGAAVPDGLSRWMALVGSSCHSSLAPEPVPTAILARAQRVPNSVVVGSHDVFLPPSRLGPAAERRLGTVLRVLDGAGHLVPEESPECAAAVMADFMRAHRRH